MRILAGVGIGAVVGILACFSIGAFVGVGNGQGWQTGFGFVLCFGWVGVVGGGGIGGLVGTVGAAVSSAAGDPTERERAGQFRLLQRDLAQAEQDLDDREAVIRELRAEVARLRNAVGKPGSDPTGGE